MIHILTIHYVDKWVDTQLEFFKKNIKSPYRVYTILGENFNTHKDKFYFAEEGKIKHYHALERLRKILKNEPTNDEDTVIVIDSDAFPIKPIDDYLHNHLKIFEFLAISEPKHNYKPLPIQPFECFYAFKYKFFEKYNFKFKYQPGIHSNWIDWMINWFKDKNIEWYPLNRTNKVDIHPLYFGIYDDIVYHHWGGSRNRVSRTCRTKSAQTGIPLEQIIKENDKTSERVFLQITNQFDSFVSYLRGEYKGELE
jgi:hypothetical protein